jgi:octanoyl-[GcvH]:protein N-octanoyltransferase
VIPVTPGERPAGMFAMEDVLVRLHLGSLDGGDQALELAVAHALVRRAGAGELGEVLRIYRPSAPVAVFGRRDTRLPGFADAAEEAATAGFEPLVRATGGRAVAYTGNALVVDHVAHEPDAMGAHDRRFERFGSLFAEALGRLGVDARVGAVPGEYCPGAHSVNARGTVKLVGTAQRVIKNAWLFSSLVIVGDEDRLQPVLERVYGHLGLPFDGASVGSLTGEAPALDIEAVERALVAAYGADASSAGGPDPDTLSLAHDLVDQHRVRPRGAPRGGAGDANGSS